MLASFGGRPTTSSTHSRESARNGMRCLHGCVSLAWSLHPRAQVHSRTDFVRGVSSPIIIGTPVPLGTGLFEVCVAPPTSAATAAAAPVALSQVLLPVAAGGRRQA